MGAPVAGTGATIDLPTGTLTGTTTFNVLATNMTTNCSVQMSGTITITVNPAPLWIEQLASNTSKYMFGIDNKYYCGTSTKHHNLSIEK